MNDILKRVRSYHKDVREQERRNSKKAKRDSNSKEALLKRLRPYIKKEVLKLHGKKVEHYTLSVEKVEGYAGRSDIWKIYTKGPIGGGVLFVSAGSWHIHIDGDPDGYPEENRWAYGIIITNGTMTGDGRNDSNTEFSVKDKPGEVDWKENWEEFIEELVVGLRRITSLQNRRVELY